MLLNRNKLSRAPDILIYHILLSDLKKKDYYKIGPNLWFGQTSLGGMGLDFLK